MEGSSGKGRYAAEISSEMLKRQHEVLREHLVSSDVVVCTAQVPGKPSPKLVTAATIERMRPGSIIVDLAGNCELSQANREVVRHDVLILAPTNLPATMPVDASVLYARNLLALLRYLIKDGELNLDVEDEIVGESLLTHQGRIVHRSMAGPDSGAL